MFKIKSNLDEVIADLERAQKAIETQLNPTILNPAIYLPLLIETARTTLEIIALPEEHPIIPGLLESIMGAADAGGMIFTMEAGAGGGGGWDFGIPGGPDKDKTLYDSILEWVADFKDKTFERDTYKGGRGRQPGEWHSNEKIAARIEAILQDKPELFMGSDNPDGLKAFLDARGSGGDGSEDSDKSGLTAESSSRSIALITAVLQSWEDVMGVKLQAVALETITDLIGPDIR